MSHPHIRRILAAITAVLLLITTSTATASASQDVHITRVPDEGGGDDRQPPTGFTVVLNGKVVLLPADRQPFAVNGRTMFPLRYLLEMLGAKVSWGYPSDRNAQVAWVEEPDTVMGFPIGQNYMIFDGEFVPLDQGAVLSEAGYTMVPMRAVIERLGGQVEWDAASRRASFTYSRPSGMRSIREKCRLHGYNIDLNPSQPGACTQNIFFIPDALISYGADKVKEWTHKGLMTDGYLVQYLNQVAAAHHGSPPRSAGEAIDATVNQLLTDIAIAEIVGLVWQPVDEEPVAGQPRRVQANAFTAPTVNGWAENEQFMTEEKVAYQSEVSGRPYRPSGRGTASRPGWVIEEYGYGVEGVEKKWFDARIGDTLIDAKSHGPELMDGSALKMNPGTMPIFEGMITDAEEQLAAAGDLKVSWYFKNEGFMNAIRAFFEDQAPDVARRLQWVYHP